MHLEKGDILVFDASNNNTLTVYRNQKIVKNTHHTVVGIAAMVRARMIQAIDGSADTTSVKLTLVQKIEENVLVAEFKTEAAIEDAVANVVAQRADVGDVVVKPLKLQQHRP